MSSDLARRIGFTIAALLLCRLGTHIPLPWIDLGIWSQIFRQHDGGVLSMANALSGGAVGRLSIFALGIIPYLSAAIVIRLVSFVSRRLRELPRRGVAGRRRIELFTLVLGIVLALIQALGIAGALEDVRGLITNPGPLFRLTTVLTLTAGVMVLVWLANQITLRGVGNGFALILAVGIIVELPAAIAGMLDFGRQGLLSGQALLGLALLMAVMAALVVRLELARRQLPLTFAPRQVGTSTIEGQSHLQFKINSAGIIPVMLASWLLVIPGAIANFFAADGATGFAAAFAHGKPLYLLLYALAIMLCVLVYTAFLLDPDEMAEDLKSYGGRIDGVEPGQPTADHLDRVLSRTNMIGAVYLAVVCLVPEVLIATMQLPLYLGGTSLLVVVCAILDLKAQLEWARRESLEGHR